MKINLAKFQLYALVFFTLVATGFVLLTTVQAQTGTVRAVLFFSPACPHCTIIKNEVLPVLNEKYGTQIQIAEIDISQKTGLELYRSAVVDLEIPQDRLGVPTLVVGGDVLVGSEEIPDLFPRLVDQYLTAGGVSWPEISGLDAFVPSFETDIEPSKSANENDSERPGWLQKFLRDPAGNLLAVLTLGLLIFVFGRTVFLFYRGESHTLKDVPVWIVPGLSLLGIGVSAYMAFVETTGTSAYCGPVGDCNSVQQSQFSMLFGVLPVGILGIAGYFMILAIWLAQMLGPDNLKPYARIGIWLLPVFGTLFSIYLTFLEPFVIGATCIWCISSALIMAALLWASTPPALAAWQNLFEPAEDLDQAYSPPRTS